MSSPPYSRFLIIQPFGIGDVLFTIPLIKNIKAQIPHAHIAFLSNRRTESLIKNYLDVNEVICYERDEFQNIYRKSKMAFLKKMLELIQQMVHVRADICIDLSLTSYFSFYAWLAKIPVRIGPNFRNRSPWLTHKVLLSGYEGRHVVEYHLDLLRKLEFPLSDQPMTMPILRQDEEWALKFFKSQHVDPHRTLIIFPGGGESWGTDAKYKRWPAERYAQLITETKRQFGQEVLLMGNLKDESLCKEIQSLVKYPLISVCSASTIGQTMAILNQCGRAVVNDGGPLHMAVASGAKTVSIFGPVDERVYGPYPRAGHGIVTSSVYCRPCYHQFRRAQCGHVRCIHDIEVNQVLQKMKEIFSYGSPIC